MQYLITCIQGLKPKLHNNRVITNMNNVDNNNIDNKNNNNNDYNNNDNNKLFKKGSQYISLSAIVTNSAFKWSKNYYPQTFLGERKYNKNKKEIKSFITYDVKSSYDDDGEENFQGKS